MKGTSLRLRGKQLGMSTVVGFLLILEKTGLKGEQQASTQSCTS